MGSKHLFFNRIDSNPFIDSQEAMENFVFPDLIKTKLMKMNELMNIFCPLKLC